MAAFCTERKAPPLAPGISGTVQVDCPLYETDVEELFKFHAPRHITLTAMANNKVVGMIKGKMSSTRTTVTKEGIFLHFNFECAVDRDFQKLDAAIGVALDFLLVLVPEQGDQPELGE